MIIEAFYKKIIEYCAYQERTHLEVNNKLKALGLEPLEIAEMISQLIAENILNEERFALLYAQSKLHQNQWGRLKIKYELNQKRVSQRNIQTALSALDETEYIETLHRVAKKKFPLIKINNKKQKLQKLTAYMQQKGFELSIIQTAISDIFSQKL